MRRASAVSLGQIGSREAVPVLVETLSDERAPNDVRREAARALGLIGDAAAVPALRSVLSHRDPYLSRIAFEALSETRSAIGDEAGRRRALTPNGEAEQKAASPRHQNEKGRRESLTLSGLCL